MKSSYPMPDFRKIYQGGIGKYQLEEILLHISLHEEDFPVIFELIFDSDKQVAFRAAWTIEKVSAKWPQWFGENQISRCTDLCLTTKHTGMHRLLISILRYLPVPDPIPVNLYNALYYWMLQPGFSIGVQSLSMKLLHKYAKTNPDLLQEFLIILEQTDPSEYTPAFYASRINILKHYK